MKQTDPHNLEAERIVLGSCTLDHSGSVFDSISELLSPTDFYNNAHAELFSAMSTVVGRGDTLDDVTLTEELRSRKTLDSVGGTAAVMAISDEGTTPSNAKAKAKVVLEKSKARRIRRSLRVGLESIEEGGKSEEVLSKLEADIIGLDAQTTSVDGLGESVDRVTEIIKAQLDGTYNPTTISTGISSLDQIYQDGGLACGTVNVIAGPPGTGKSALSLNMGMKAAIKDGLPVAVFSLEMMEDQLVKRMSSMMSRVSMNKVRDRSINADEQNRLFEQLQRIKGADIFTHHYIKDVDHACTIARQMKRKRGIKLLIVDYLQLIKSKAGQGRIEAIEDITQSLKRLAIELDIPIVLLAQFNREGCLREGGPTMFDLKGGSSIEQDADTILAMWVKGGDFEAAKRQDGGGKEYVLVDWKLAKNREGEPGVTGQFKFYNSYGAFMPYDHNPVTFEQADAMKAKQKEIKLDQKKKPSYDGDADVPF